MASTTTEREATAPTTRRSPGWFGSLREALDRPLTCYYLLLGASALLLTIGLIMVLSASSVYSYEMNDGDSYAVVKRQLMWVGARPPRGVRRVPDVAAGAALARVAGHGAWR